MSRGANPVDARVEEIFYNVDVTSAELWKAVGKALKLRRVEMNWRPIDVERAGGPSYKTVQAIEAGDAGTVESLDKCARALELSIVDILQAVIESKLTPLTPEAAHVVRKFNQMTVRGRSAIVALADALPRAASPAVPPSPDAEATPTKPRPPRVVPPGVKRRTVR